MTDDLTEADKVRRLQACTNLLKYQRKEKILDWVITCDKKYIYLNSTSQKEGWFGQFIGREAKRILTDKNIMLCISGVIAVVLSINSAWKKLKS